MTTSDGDRSRERIAQLLRDAITRSGLSTDVYARDVLFRDARTVRRWRRGEFTIPREVADALEEGKLPGSQPIAQ